MSLPTTTLCGIAVRLKSLHAHQCTELFENHKLECGGGCESRPDGEESTPESGGTLLRGDFNHTVHSVVVQLGVGGLVHQSRTDHVEGCDSTSHEETSSDGRHELRKKGLLWQTSQGDDVSFGLIVHTHLGTVEDHRTGNVGINTTIEARHTLLGEQLRCRLGDRRGIPTGRHHHSRLQHIEGVCGKEREQKRWVLVIRTRIVDGEH